MDQRAHTKQKNRKYKKRSNCFAVKLEDESEDGSDIDAKEIEVDAVQLGTDKSRSVGESDSDHPKFRF